jgi:hypothetical protein
MAEDEVRALAFLARSRKNDRLARELEALRHPDALT